MSILDYFKKPSIQPEITTDVNHKIINFNEVDTKAFIKDTGVNQWQFFYGQSSSKYYTPKQLLAYNTGWVYTCNNRNATTLSTIPIKLYYKNKSGSEVKYFKSKSLTGKQIKYIERTTQKAISSEVVEIENHPVIDLLHCPNPRMN